MIYIVTGSSGFIGHHLVRRLQIKSTNVIGLDIQDPPDGASPDCFIQCDVSRPTAPQALLDKIPRGSQFTVFHLAAQVSVQSTIEDWPAYCQSNLTGLANMILLCSTAGGRLVFASSGAAAQSPPGSIYSLTKSVGEQLLQLSGLPHWVALRFSNVYGPMYKVKGVVGKFIDRMRRGLEVPIHGDGTQVRDFIYVDDIVEALISAGRQDEHGVYGIGTGIGTSVNNLLTMLQDKLEVQAEQVLEAGSPGIVNGLQDEPMYQRGRKLGWTAKVPLDEGLRHTIECWKAGS